MQLICRDGSLSVCMQDLAHASPMVLAGAVEAMCVDSYFCDAGQPCLRVGVTPNITCVGQASSRSQHCCWVLQHSTQHQGIIEHAGLDGH